MDPTGALQGRLGRWLRDAGGPPSPMSVASAELGRSGQTSPRYSSKPIREIQPIADRVLADNPETPGQAPSDFGEFHAANWRLVKMVVRKPDHEWMKVTLSRPQAWIEAAQRDSEGRIWLEFKELGIANWANVLAIEPCPEAAVGEGRLVTGTFEHSSGDVLNLFIAVVVNAMQQEGQREHAGEVMAASGADTLQQEISALRTELHELRRLLGDKMHPDSRGGT